MQLRRDVAELGDVELLGGAAERFGGGADRGAGAQDLLHQDVALARRQVFQLARAGDLRDQHDPGEPGVGLHPDMAQRQVADGLGGGQEGRVDLEHGAS